MKKFFKLFVNYFSDRKSKYLRLYKPGKTRVVGFWVIIGFMIPFYIYYVFHQSELKSIIEAGVFILIFLPLFLYFGLLASHIIVTEEYVEYVEYFIKRRKIKLYDIKGYEHILLFGIAPTIIIYSNNPDDRVIEINYSMFNSPKELNEFIKLIGSPERIRSRAVTKTKGKKGTAVCFWMSKVISFALCIDIFIIILFFMVKTGFVAKNKKMFDGISRLSTIAVVILGFKYSSIIEDKLRKKSLKHVVLLGISSILSIPFMLLVSYVVFK